MLFKAVVFTKQVSCGRRIVFGTSLGFLIFDPNWSFCKGYSFCVVANFSHFQNALIFGKLGVFWSGVFSKQVSCCRRIVFCTFLAFLIFDRNRPFCKGCSPCVVANFGHYQSAPIFRILGAFQRGFLHKISPMWSENGFSHLFGIFKFFFVYKQYLLQHML